MMFPVAIALLAAMGANAKANPNTPASLTVCQPAQLSWTGGTPPYYVSLLPGGDASGTPLRTWPQQDGTTITWKVDLAAGTSVTLEVKDSTGAPNYGEKVTIVDSDDDSCVKPAGGNATADSSDSSSSDSSATADANAASGTDAAASNTGAAGANTAAAETKVDPSATSSGSKTSDTAPASTSSNGAGMAGVSGALAFAAVVVAAVL